MKTLFRKINYIVLLFVVFSVVPTFATNYYVDAAKGNNSNTGYSSTSSKKTIQAAADLTNPGDTVFVMNGIYADTTDVNVINITRSGAEGKYITYKPMKGHTPKFRAWGKSWNCILIDNCSYIVLDGFELEGNNANIKYDDAYASYVASTITKNTAGIQTSNFNTNAIVIAQKKPVHHVIVRNCKVHDFPGGGVIGFKVDYITLENNVVYNNAWYMMYGGSGISIFGPKAIDDVTTYKVILRNNIVYNNKTLIPWNTVKHLSDGNGIILDANNGTQGMSVYTGRTLVENNVCYNNGGGGVHAYSANHVDIINNTAYNNGTIVGYPEIDANQCSDVKIYNNIMYGRGTGTDCNGNDAGAVYDYNLYFNGTSYKNGPHDITADPKFVNKGLDGTANFRLLSTSPAINNGSNIAGQFTPKDILGLARTVGFTTDMGAYEYSTVIPRAEIQLKQGTTEIYNNIGSFNFGDVASTSPKIVTFTIQNIGNLALNLKGTPKNVVVAGGGFSLVTDAPATVSANGSVTFKVKFNPSTTIGEYSGIISIASNDVDENTYTFALKGYGYNGDKAVQTITFNANALKDVATADFVPGAATPSGLTIAYASSDPSVATIVSGKIHIVGEGTTTITASQAGDAATNIAKNVTQVLTITPVLPPLGTNLITNSAFNENTTGWSIVNKNEVASTLEMISLSGYDTKVGKVTASATALGNKPRMDNILLCYTVYVVKGRNYLVSFKGSGDVACNIKMALLMNASPKSSIYNSNIILLTTTPANYGPYNFTSSYTGYVSYRLQLGSTTTVYLDDISIMEDTSTSVNKIEVNK